MNKKRPRFEDPSYCNAVLKSKLPPYGVTFRQRRARYLFSVLKIFFKDIPKDVIQIISGYTSEDFDYFDLSRAVKLEFIVDFPDYMDEDDIPLDSFDHVKHDYPTYEFIFTRAYNVFYWWPSENEEERKQELSLMCEHMDSLDDLAEFIEDKTFGLDLDDVQFDYASFNDDEVQNYVEEELKKGSKKIKINMWVHHGDE